MGLKQEQQIFQGPKANDFFAKVPVNRFPSAGDQKQPWKDLMRAQAKAPNGDGPLAVLCSQRYDYGMSDALGPAHQLSLTSHSGSQVLGGL